MSGFVGGRKNAGDMGSYIQPLDTAQPHWQRQGEGCLPATLKQDDKGRDSIARGWRKAASPSGPVGYSIAAPPILHNQNSSPPFPNSSQSDFPNLAQNREVNRVLFLGSFHRKSGKRMGKAAWVALSLIPQFKAKVDCESRSQKDVLRGGAWQCVEIPIVCYSAQNTNKITVLLLLVENRMLWYRQL